MGAGIWARGGARFVGSLAAGLLAMTPVVVAWGPSAASAASGPTVSIGDASIVEGDVHARGTWCSR